MKKLVSLVALLSVLSQFAFVASAAVGTPYMEDDFGSFAADAKYTGAYTNSQAARNMCYIREDSTGKYLEVSGKDAGTNVNFGINMVFGATDVATINFDYRLPAGVIDGAHFYCNGSSLNGELDNQPLFYQASGVAAVKPDIQFATERWYDLTAVIDNVNKSFDLYVDGIQYLNDTPYRSASANITSFQVYISNTNVAAREFHIRDINVYKKDITLATEYTSGINAKPETEMSVSLADAYRTVNDNLSNCYAVASGYTIAYSKGAHESVTAVEQAPSKSDDFDSFEVGAKYTGDYVYNADATNLMYIREDNKGKYLEVNGANAGSLTNFGVAMSGSSADVLTINFDYRIPSGITDAAHFYCNGMTLNGELDPTITVYQSVLPHLSASNALPAGAWHDVTAVLNNTDHTFDLYVNGTLLFDDKPYRSETAVVNGFMLYISNTNVANRKFHVRDINMYEGEVVPKTSASGIYAPIYKNGIVYAPANFVAKAFGGTYANGVITKSGAQSYTVPEVLAVGTETYIGITEALEDHFGIGVYTDDRGVAIIGSPVSTSEAVIKSLLSELRNYSALFGEGVKSDVLFSTRSWHSTATEAKKYSTMDALKRFMATSTRWTYLTDDTLIDNLNDMGSDVQAGLNQVPLTYEYDSNGKIKTEIAYYGSNYQYSKTVNVFVASSRTIEGWPFVRPTDGLADWGCVNNPQFLTDLKTKAKDAIDRGQYLFQFDDHPLNYGYGGCFCDHCMTAFATWLKDTKGYTTYQDLVTNYKANYTTTAEKNTAISNFNYKTYLANKEGIKTVSAVNTYRSNTGTNMADAYDEFNLAAVIGFHEDLRAYMDEYAASKNMRVYVSNNNSAYPYNIRKDTVYMYDSVFDAGMGETGDWYMQAQSIFLTAYAQQEFKNNYVYSPHYLRGGTTMQLVNSAVPLLYATGQYSLIPWDDWIEGSSRYYASVEELENNFAFVRENSYLFDNYETPQKVGYVICFDEDDTLLSHGSYGNSTLLVYTEALGRKGMPVKLIAVRRDAEPYMTFTEADLEGLSGLLVVNLGGINSTTANSWVATARNKGIPAVSYTAAKGTWLNYQTPETNTWAARIENLPENMYAVLRTHSYNEDAPVVVHAVNYNGAVQKNVNVQINNTYLPGGSTFTVKIHAPGKNPVTKTVTKGTSITTVTIDELENWSVLEICGADQESIASFNVSGLSGMGLGSRVSYDSAAGTADNFTITTYGEGLNVYTQNDQNAGQDEVGYVFKRLTGDDFEISAKIGEASGSSGLMLRSALHSNAASVALEYSSENGLRFGKRHTDNVGYRFTKVSDAKPEYMKLSLKDSVVTAYTSNDGANWTDCGSLNIYFKPETAGAFASGNGSGKATCTIEGLTITEFEKTLAYDVASKNIMQDRNYSFAEGAIANYNRGYDGIYSGTATVTKSTESADGDGASIKITSRSSGNAAVWYGTLPVEDGKTYEASVWAKVDSGKADTGEIVFEKPGTYNGFGYESNIVLTEVAKGTASLSSDWQRVFVRFKVAETGKDGGINIRFKTTGTADIYLDSFELKEVHEIGDGINAMLYNRGNKAVLDLSTDSGETKNIMYALKAKSIGDDGVERASFYDIQTLTVTESTLSKLINLDGLDDGAEIYLWDADTLSPVIRRIPVIRTR